MENNWRCHMNDIKFCTRKEGFEILQENKRERTAFDLSSYGAWPMNMFSPFYNWKPYGLKIPIPPSTTISENPGELPHAGFSYTVEAIWQGLKIVDGKTDFEQFTGKPHKRGNPSSIDSTCQGFIYGNDVIRDYIEARKKIYVPTYTYMFKKFSPLMIAKYVLFENVRRGRDVYLFDVDDNPNIEDPTKSYSHAALIYELLKKE